MDLILRPATAADLPAIAAIQGFSSWDPAAYLDHDCSVAAAGQSVVGFLVCRETTPGEREILNIAVDPAHRRRGIARRLLEAELSHFRATRYLEVRESNAAAIQLYESLGFRASGRRPGYYSDPPEAAIVMRFFS